MKLNVSLHLAFAAAVLVPLAGWPAPEDTLAITGTIDSAFPLAAEHGIPHEQYTVAFQMRVSGCKWWARWTDSRWKKTDWFEAGFDGETSHQIRSMETFANRLQQSGTNIGAHFEGRVGRGPIPRDLGSDMITFVWYAFASKCYLTGQSADGRKESPWQTINPGEDGRLHSRALQGELLPAKWSFAPPGRTLEFIHFHGRGWSSEEAPPSPPLGEIFVEESRLALDGVPFSSVIRYWRRDSTGRLLENHTLRVLSVMLEAGETSGAGLQPKLPGPTFVTDLRFQDEAPTVGQITYMTTRWLSPDEVRKLPAFQRVRQVEQVISENENRLPKWLVILASLLTASCGILLHQFRGRNHKQFTVT